MGENRGVERATDMIVESNVIVFAPHYDDLLLTIGGYVLALRASGTLCSKRFSTILVFSRATYLAVDADGNFDTSDERIARAGGVRLQEDLSCHDELFGLRGYRYELLTERECFLRGKVTPDSMRDIPYGTYEHFVDEDWAILANVRRRVSELGRLPDTAVVVPIAIKEHIDHFIVREAALEAFRDLGADARASLYLHEDKPYGGMANQEELDRIESLVLHHRLQERIYSYDPAAVVELFLRCYPSQAGSVYDRAIQSRASALAQRAGSPSPCDRLFTLTAPSRPSHTRHFPCSDPL